MKNIVLTILFLAITLMVSGSGSQNLSLSVKVKNGDQETLPGATVQLTSMIDSVRVSRITNQDGVAVFDGLQQGVHNIRISFVGFEPIERSLMIKEEKQQQEFLMRTDAISLGEVTVTARRPLMRQEGDRMIIDPEPLASISTNTLEILESTPGLFVDPDGGIYLSSATPATIYINGREQKMSNQDINTLLRSLPPGSVQQIEVIRTPSARFAASSSGGVINIVLRRGVRIGRFGSLSSGMNQGVYGNRFFGVTLNNGGDRVTSYINLNYSNNNGLEELSSSRLLRQDTTLFQSARTRRQSHQGFVGYGLSFDASERVNLSYDGRINGSLPNADTRNANVISTSLLQTISETDNLVDNDSRFLSIQQDLGFKLRLDTLGSEWDTKLGYSFNSNNTFQEYANIGLYPVFNTIAGEGDNDQQRHFIQFQSDLSLKLPFALTMETGVSASYQEYESDAGYFILFDNNPFPDPFRTRAFNFRENITAGYLQFSRPLPLDLTLKTGIRLEHTYMKGNQTIPADTSFVVNRADWFPYVFLSRPLFSIEGFTLQSFMIYRRTITRPGYQSLNPYVNYIDQFLYEVGNPGLKPQFADNFELNISLDDMPIFALGRSYTRDIFSGVVYQDPVNENVAIRTYDNLGKSKETYFRAIAGIPPGGRYFFAFGAQYNLNEYEGVYEGSPLSFSRGSWRLFTFHMLRLAKDTRLTMSGFMMTRGQMNFYELNTFGALNLGLNQTFLNRRLTITLSARDVLRTMVTEFELNQGNISTTGSRYMDNQRFGVSVRYNFGIPQRQERQNMFRFENGDQG